MMELNSKFGITLALICMAVAAALLVPPSGFAPSARASSQSSPSLPGVTPDFVNSSAVASPVDIQTPQELYKPSGESFNVTIAVDSAVSVNGSLTDPGGTLHAVASMTDDNTTTLEFYVGPEAPSGYYTVQVNLVNGPNTVVVQADVVFTNYNIPFTPPVLGPLLP